MPRRRALVAAGLVLVLALIFRFALVHTFRSSSPDAAQYYALSQSLVRDHRFAYRPPPAPATWTRLPGYPLFLAGVAVREVTPLEQHIERATAWNVLLDAGTALLLLAMLWQRRAGGAVVALALILTSPILFLFASYGLTESLATFLTTLTIFFALRAMRSRTLLYAALAGLAAGAGQLVRADVITVAPAIALALWWARLDGEPLSLNRRLLALAVAATGWLAVTTPWMLRNQRDFGAPHLMAAEWPAQDGRPLPTGMIAWMRTWASGQPGEADLAGAVALDVRMAPERLLHPRMVDDANERARVLTLIDGWRQHGLPFVDDGFRQLARERLRHHPLRTLVTLPLERLIWLYRAPRAGDFPLRVPWLGLPRHRPLFDVWNALVYLLAATGAALLYRRGQDERRLLAIVAAAIVGRTLVHLYAVPPFVSERYLVEVLPLFCALAAVALAALARSAWRRSGPPHRPSPSESG